MVTLQSTRYMKVSKSMGVCLQLGFHIQSLITYTLPKLVHVYSACTLASGFHICTQKCRQADLTCKQTHVQHAPDIM